MRYTEIFCRKTRFCHGTMPLEFFFSVEMLSISRPLSGGEFKTTLKFTKKIELKKKKK